MTWEKISVCIGMCIVGYLAGVCVVNLAIAVIAAHEKRVSERRWKNAEAGLRKPVVLRQNQKG